MGIILPTFMSIIYESIIFLRQWKQKFWRGSDEGCFRNILRETRNNLQESRSPRYAQSTWRIDDDDIEMKGGEIFPHENVDTANSGALNEIEDNASPRLTMEKALSTESTL